jgi:hypothetical protein
LGSCFYWDVLNAWMFMNEVVGVIYSPNHFHSR